MTTKRSEEDVTRSPQELRYRVDADANRLGVVRTVLGSWVSDLGMSREQRSDVVLAAYEAMANAAEHAYVGRTDGVIDLWARCVDDVITIIVTDYGVWRPQQPSDGLRGRGLMLINALTQNSDVSHGDGGTTITMSWPSPRRE